MITLEGRLTEINVKGKGASGVGSLKITHEAEDMRSRLGKEASWGIVQGL